jgi:hypothetical protein
MILSIKTCLGFQFCRESLPAGIQQFAGGG